MKTRVLLVDDEKQFVEVLSQRLMTRDFELLTAFNGDDALTILEKLDVDFVVLDVMMESPDSGFEFLNEMNSKNLTTPVILCSSIAKASQMNFDIYSLGAKVVMQKPVDLDKLVENVKKYCSAN